MMIYDKHSNCLVSPRALMVEVVYKNLDNFRAAIINIKCNEKNSFRNL